MIRSKKNLVAPLEDRWRDVLDGIARSQRFPTSSQGKELGVAVAQLSSFYNGITDEIPVHQALAARLLFSFPRDVPKGAAALTELAPLLPLDRPLQVLDLGAGLGAMTWGAARLWAALGASGELHATLVDQDSRALALASRIANAVHREQRVAVQLRTITAPLEKIQLQEADLVLVGQALSEMFLELPDEERVERQLLWLQERLEHNVAPGGALVIIEPALRDRTRHLHRLRAGLIARGWSIFAPCLHDGGCPMLANDHDWCHEDLSIDLPEWLIPIARAAGLRFQGLTFSYLILRRDRRTLRERLPMASWRVVRAPKKTKGKQEIELCGETVAPESLLAMRLDRDRSEMNAAWEEVKRGDIIRISSTSEKLHRIHRDSQVTLVEEIL